MANNVFANGREISCKKADGKTICAFPDICMTPPVSPATPSGVPIPYPNTGMAKDTTNGSRTVKISGNEIIKKNVSYYKTSYGDEAGCATPAKKGIITGTIKGKVYFTSWSMDVKVEGKNAVRHIDTTTHNHGSTANEYVPWLHLDKLAAFGDPPECAKQKKAARKSCKNSKLIKVPMRDKAGTIKRTKKGKIRREDGGVKCSKKCREAMACILVPKKDDNKKCCACGKGGVSSVPTGHHMIEDHWVKGNPNFKMAHKTADPNGYQAAPTVCTCGGRFEGKHGVMHAVQGVFEESYIGPDGARFKKGAKSGGFNYKAAKEATLNAHEDAFPKAGCGECLEAQLDSFYGKDDRRSMNKPSKQSISKKLREPTEEYYSDILGDY